MTRGSKIRDLRLKRQMTQMDLAQALGIKTQGTISAWENDKQDIDGSNLVKLIDLFKVSPEVLDYEVPRSQTDAPTDAERSSDAWLLVEDIPAMRARIEALEQDVAEALTYIRQQQEQNA